MRVFMTEAITAADAPQLQWQRTPLWSALISSGALESEEIIPLY